jgi:hypothetical protein
MKFYIAGSITNNPTYKEDFKSIEKELIKRGHAVINPVKNLGFSYRDYIDMGLAELSKCDAVFLLPNWYTSVGADLEKYYADVVGLAIYVDINRVPRGTEVPRAHRAIIKEGEA